MLPLQKAQTLPAELWGNWQDHQHLPEGPSNSGRDSQEAQGIKVPGLEAHLYVTEGTGETAWTQVQGEGEGAEDRSGQGSRQPAAREGHPNLKLQVAPG